MEEYEVSKEDKEYKVEYYKKQSTRFFLGGIGLFLMSIMLLFHLDYQKKLVCLKSVGACVFSSNKALSRNFEGYDGFQIADITDVKSHIYVTKHIQKGRTVRRTHYKMRFLTGEPAIHDWKHFNNHDDLMREIKNFKQYWKNSEQEKYELNHEAPYVLYIGLILMILSVIFAGISRLIGNKI